MAGGTYHLDARVVESTLARAEATVVTKADLLPHVPFRLDEARAQVRTLQPAGAWVVTSATTGAGIDE